MIGRAAAAALRLLERVGLRASYEERHMDRHGEGL